MSKALSVDQRVRVLAAVCAGATHREAAERFGVSAKRQPLAKSATSPGRRATWFSWRRSKFPKDRGPWRGDHGMAR